MKKLMIAAAAAAMIGSAFADAQVYEYKLTLTTTTCKEAKAVNSYLTKMGLFIKGEELVYRTKASQTLNGVSWGCYCNEALAGTWGTVTPINSDGLGTSENWYGLTFFNKKTDTFLGGVYNGTEFTWDVMNRIGKKGEEIELAFEIGPSDAAIDDNFKFVLAGLGCIKDNIKIVADEDDAEITDCLSIIKSAKGSVAGYLNPEDGIVVCNYCEDYGVACDVWQFCDCGDDYTDATRTVAYGTWTMKYNSGASKKLTTKAKITESYSGFSKGVKAALVAAGE